MKKIWTLYLPQYPKVLLYMLQGSEYNVREYVKWFHRTHDYRKVIKRRTLVWTNKVKLLAFSELVIIALTLSAAWFASNVWIPLGWIILLLTPYIMAYGVIVPLLIGEIAIQNPRKKKLVAAARALLSQHPAKKIAIAGSYGKTTTREVLKTVLAEKYKVAATPGNLNTPLGISRFAQTLDGDEEVLIFEMGESHVGDIQELSELVRPELGIITGINEAHLASFKSIDNTIATIFELQDFLVDKPLYKNIDDEIVRSKVNHSDPLAYGNRNAEGWTLTDANTTLEGTQLTAERNGVRVQAQTQLIGGYTLGTLMLAIAIGDRFGLSARQIEQGLAKVKPFEHRMEPRHLHGALIIDDTYNGNIKGMEAGLKLLKDSDAKRRVYVTPGLVEQGNATATIHERIGKLIAESADVVVLMRNSVTEYITNGLREADFKGQLMIVDEPLEFYTGLEHFVAAGDVVLMQNDWTDNYA